MVGKIRIVGATKDHGEKDCGRNEELWEGTELWEGRECGRNEDL
jgi:hypothetical protein